MHTNSILLHLAATSGAFLIGHACLQNKKLVEKIKQLADRKGCTLGQLALAWVHHQGDDVFPIPGTKRIKYLEENIAAFQVKLSKQELDDIEEIVPHDAVGNS